MFGPRSSRRPRPVEPDAIEGASAHGGHEGEVTRRILLSTLLAGSVFASLLGVPALTAEAAPAAGFHALGDLPGGAFSSRTLGLGADGHFVVGASIVDEDGREEGFRWDAEEGLVALGDLPGGARVSRATAISGDGRVVVGTSQSASGKEGFRWSTSEGMLGLGDLRGGEPHQRRRVQLRVELPVRRVAVGVAQSIRGVRTWPRAFRWTADVGMVDLGTFEDGRPSSRATDVSADGRTIVGSASSSRGRQAALWREEEAIVGLGDLPGGAFDSRALAIAPDATVVVGVGTGQRGPEAFRWSARSPLSGLGDLPGGDHDSEALAVSLGGDRIVGRGTSERGDEAFLWSPTQGLRLLEQVAREAGLEIPEAWRLERAIAISHDGGTIAGTGTNPDGAREAWLIVLPSE